MKVIRKTKDYTIYQKRSGRYCVQDSAKNWINQEKKVTILAAEGLIKIVTSSKAVPEKSEKEKHRKAVSANEQSPAKADEEFAAEVAEEVVSEESAAEEEEEAVSEESAAESEEGAIAEKGVPEKTEKKPRAKRARKPDDEATKKSPSTIEKKKIKNEDN